MKGDGRAEKDRDGRKWSEVGGLGGDGQCGNGECACSVSYVHGNEMVPQWHQFCKQTGKYA